MVTASGHYTIESLKERQQDFFKILVPIISPTCTYIVSRIPPIFFFIFVLEESFLENRILIVHSKILISFNFHVKRNKKAVL